MLVSRFFPHAAQVVVEEFNNVHAEQLQSFMLGAVISFFDFFRGDWFVVTLCLRSPATGPEDLVLLPEKRWRN